ncbi:MAG: porin [Candidatus Accumulibacter sp.]|jgi:predicted porin|nr:porin [Accumulibacter sp.]
MQKKVIALAVAGLVSGAAFAQTNVTIYGTADATVESVQAKDATATGADILNYNRVNSNSSILGFRGSEDLGGGLKAIFQFETNINLDSDSGSTSSTANSTTTAIDTTTGNAPTSTTTADNLAYQTTTTVRTTNSQRNTIFGSRRDTFVGLQGGFGQFKAGTLTGPARSLGAAVDLVAGATGIGSAIPMFGKLGGNGGRAFGHWDTRYQNAIQYVTPKFGGFEVRALYGAGEQRPQGTKAAASYEIGGFYINGPWYAGLTYGQAKPNTADFANPNTALGYGYEKLTNVRLAGKYTFQGGHQIATLFEQNKATDYAGGTETAKSSTYGIGGKFKVSQPGAIIAQLYQVSKLKGGSTPTIGQDDYKANFIALGYEHSLSKRTTLKAYYSRISNKDNAHYNYGIGNINNAALGSNPTGLAVGIRHTF